MTWVMTPGGKLHVGKILCLVRNYRAHAEESGQGAPSEATYFMKPSTSIIHDGEKVIAPRIAHDLQAEAELAVVMGSTARGISRNSSIECVLGYAVFLDITARNLQRSAIGDGLPWTLAKGMDTFAPVSEVRARGEVADPHDLEIRLRVNGVTRQKASTGEMIHRVPDIIASISSHMTLQKGDILATGTPEGVPTIRPGDLLEADIEGVGQLRIGVEAPSPP
ncbi:MAG: fumarylacetoacetate hydrolase family protein [Thermoplasmata archaeon]